MSFFARQISRFHTSFDFIIQNAPSNMAMTDDQTERFFEKSRGLLLALPSLLDPSLNAPYAKLIMIIVPTQYDDKNIIDDCQDVIAIAGAKLGAPSQENPCKIPLANTAVFFLGFSVTTSSSSSLSNKFSLSPNKPIAIKLKPTAFSASDDRVLMYLKRFETVPFKINAAIPIKIADKP